MSPHETIALLELNAELLAALKGARMLLESSVPPEEMSISAFGAYLKRREAIVTAIDKADKR